MYARNGHFVFKGENDISESLSIFSGNLDGHTPYQNLNVDNIIKIRLSRLVKDIMTSYNILLNYLASTLIVRAKIYHKEGANSFQ